MANNTSTMPTSFFSPTIPGVLVSLLLTIALLLAGCNSTPLDTEEDLIALDRAWAAAVVANDLDSLEKLCAPDLIYAHSDGQVDSYEVYLNRLRNQTSDYQAIDISQISAKLFGDTAVVNVRANFRVLADGRQINNDLAYTHVYLKRDGEWQLIAHQSARMQPPA
jgi:ketosteroid isomerase-like protein